MSIDWSLKILLSTLLLPPGNGLLLLCLAGLFRGRRWAFGLAVVGTALLLAQSLPPVANALIASLENQNSPLAPTTKPKADAIVVLGSSLVIKAREYGGDTANERTLLRARYGATLARQTGLPVLVSGGRPPEASRSEAEVMAGILDKEFGVKVRWQETTSSTTAENAAFSAPILKAAGIHRVLLVTQAFHMPRARRLFEQAGIEVVPAPTAFKNQGNIDWPPINWLPQSSALQTSYFALHEWLGIAWIALKP